MNTLRKATKYQEDIIRLLKTRSMRIILILTLISFLSALLISAIFPDYLIQYIFISLGGIFLIIALIKILSLAYIKMYDNFTKKDR